MTFSFKMSWAPTVLVAIAIVGVAIGVQRFAAPAGGLQLSQGKSGNGDPTIRTEGLAYPRAAMDRDGFRVRISHPAHRIVSQYWSLDDYLYSVAPPESVVAVSESAYQASFSNVYGYAQRYKPAVVSDPEQVLVLAPDLILAADDTTPESISLMRSTGIPVYRTQVTFLTLQQIEDTIGLVGYLTGYDDSARLAREHFHRSVESVRRRAATSRARGQSAPRILGLGGMQYGYGGMTLFHDMVQTLGGINVAAEAGLEGFSPLDLEQIVHWNPEWIFAGANQGQVESTRAMLLANPALALTDAARHHHIVVFENHVFQPMSPYSILLLNAMADTLYGADGGGHHS